MRDFTIMHVGDLHFDDLRDARTDIDAKDNGISSGVRDVLGAHPLQAVMQPLAEQLEFCDAAMIVGDLSSYGDLGVYVDAVKYLNVALALPDREMAAVHAVVGNHDVDRQLIAPGTRTEADVLAKFAPLTDTWVQHSVPILEPAAVRRSEVVVDGVGLELFSMNSCIGCGEYRERELASDIEEELRTRMAAGDKSARDSIFEQLDSPGFLDRHLTEVTGAIRGLSSKRVPVVLAHHNVLPQFQPRLQIYTEMVNAGAARARLAACDRPVLYLHGHIHDEPIEVIEQHHPHRGRLIAISAPEVQRGFNIINISFGQRDLPLGVTITPWRYAYGEVRPEASVRISLRRQDQENHEAMPEIAAVMAQSGQMRYSRFVTSYREVFGDGRGEVELQEALIEGDWAGVVTIDNRDDDPAQWIVRSPLL